MNDFMGNKERKQQKEKRIKEVCTYGIAAKMGRVQKFKMHIYLSENDVLKETDQKYAKYVNVP